VVDAVPDPGLLGPEAVVGRRDVRVEGERVPCEPPAGLERVGDPLEHAAAVGPGRQVQQAPERAVDERRRLVQLEFAHVALTQLKWRARLGRPLARLRKHCRRAVDSEHRADRLRHRNSDPAVPDRELDHGPVASRASST
jgi:hypothetical protein